MGKSLSHLSELQLAELNVFKSFDKICKKYDILYYVTGGSMLGAVRHHGFIPWDDDMDVCMPREEYNKFVSHVDELPQSMYLSYFDTPGHIWLVPRVIDKETRFYLNNAQDKKEIGAWLDILILDGIPKPIIQRTWLKMRYLVARMLYQFSNFSTAVNLHREGRPWYEYALINFAKHSHIEKVLNPKWCGHFYDKVCKSYRFDDCDDVCALSGALQFKEVFPKEWLGEGVMMEFEDVIVKAYTEWDKFLTFIYGDYMTPPPLDKRNKHNVMKVE